MTRLLPFLHVPTRGRQGRILVLALAATCFCLAAEVHAQFKAVQPIKEWKGSVKNEALMEDAPKVITSAAKLQALWKAWEIPERVPEVDFKKELVAVSTTRGSRINLTASLDERGDLRLLGVATRDIKDGFRYVIATFPRQGVKTVQGKELPNE